MKKLWIFFSFLAFSATSQNIGQCRQRFDHYLNFRGSLNGVVRFEKDNISIYPSGKKSLVIYENEIPALASFFENSTIKEQEQLIRSKGAKRFSEKEIDSLKSKTSLTSRFLPQVDQLPLKGCRIALDPGHFGTTLAEAAVEQKFLYFMPQGTDQKDSVKLFESYLTFNTATILKRLLEEQGATVFLTRDQSNHTSFGCTFTEFFTKHKKRTLDSLQKEGALTPGKYTMLLKAKPYVFFWEFFRDYDLGNRAKKINEFRPHLTVIIHYNVDEKNSGWKKHTSKNFTMAFIGGAFTADNLARVEGKVNFLRLLLTDQLNRSQQLANNTVLNFNKQLQIDIARPEDADYLKNNCLATSSPGVFCRNLALCRKINSPLVYGESLYQDNVHESARLMKSDVDLYGIKTNERLQTVAQGYFDALMQFIKQVE